MNIIKKFLTNIEEYILLVTLPLMTVIVVAATAVRYFELGSLSWSEEAARYLMIISAYAGISIGFKDDTHLGMSFVVDFLPPKFYKAIRILRDFIIIFFSFAFTYFSFSIVSRQRVTHQASASMGIPMWIVYSSMLIGFILISFRSIQLLIRDLKQDPSINNDNDEVIL